METPSLKNLSIDFRKIENELFNIKVNQEVTVAPLREYIEESLKRDLVKIIETPTKEVNIEHLTTTRKDTKVASTSK